MAIKKLHVSAHRAEELYRKLKKDVRDARAAMGDMIICL